MLLTVYGECCAVLLRISISVAKMEISMKVSQKNVELQ